MCADIPVNNSRQILVTTGASGASSGDAEENAALDMIGIGLSVDG